MRELSYINAIAEAQKEEMGMDKNVFVIGEDVDLFGGVFKATVGIEESFNDKRLFGTPISESAFTGLAAGAALTGLRPIVEFMYFDFVLVAMDQIVNQIAKVRHMSGGGIKKMPIVMRAQAGIGTCEAAQHSQSLEAWFVHVPGIKVVVPGTVYDAKGLLKSAIRDDNPVLFVENRMLYYEREEVPEGSWIVPIGEAEVAREGSDVTVVALGYARRAALQAAEILGDSVKIEVIDPRTVNPLDTDTIIKSLQKTGRLLVVHEAPARAGIGAEIVRRIMADGFDYMDAPPMVLGGKSLPIPFSSGLENACYPQVEDIVELSEKMAKNKI